MTNQYRAWTPEEDATLRNLADGSRSPKEVAALIGRTAGAVQTRASVIGVLFGDHPDRRRTKLYVDRSARCGLEDYAPAIIDDSALAKVRPRNVDPTRRENPAVARVSTGGL